MVWAAVALLSLGGCTVSLRSGGLAAAAGAAAHARCTVGCWAPCSVFVQLATHAHSAEAPTRPTYMHVAGQVLCMCVGVLFWCAAVCSSSSCDVAVASTCCVHTRHGLCVTGQSQVAASCCMCSQCEYILPLSPLEEALCLLFGCCCV